VERNQRQWDYVLVIEGYPKTKYPKHGSGSALVTSPEQEKGLGDDWQDFPAPIPQEQPVVEEPPQQDAPPPKRRGRKPKEQPSPPPQP
jgi:hypothetical protein